MKQPKSYGYTVNLETAKKLRKEIQQGLKGDGRKAHYMKLKGAFAKGEYRYWVWIDPLVDCVQKENGGK